MEEINNNLKFICTLRESLKSEGATCLSLTKLPKTSNNPEGKGYIFEFGHIQGYCSDGTVEMLGDASIGVEAYSICEVEILNRKLFVLKGNRNTFATRDLIHPDESNVDTVNSICSSQSNSNTRTDDLPF